MTTLYLVRTSVSVDMFGRWAAERELGWARERGRIAEFDEGRALHHLLNETLGPGAIRSFRFLVPPRRKNGNLYGYSTQDAEALRANAHAYAPPEHIRVLFLDRLESKPMPSDWRIGQRLGFDIRARPVRRLLRSLGKGSCEIGKGKEVDAFLLEALREHPDNSKGMENENRTREAVYLDWLTHQLAPSAELDREASRLVRFRRARAVRGNASPEGPDITIQGTLIVADPAAFTDLLARGVGRHRAYGSGMLLLRPPNRPAPGR